MIVLAVIGIIVLLIALLLNMKLRAEIKFYGGKLDFKVKYLFFTIFPLKEKKEKPKKKSSPSEEKVTEKAKKSYKGEESYTVTKAEIEAAKKESALKEAEISEKTQSSEKSKEKLSEKINKLTDLIEKIKIIWSSSQKGLRRIFKHIYIDGIVLDFVIAEGDAYDTAIRYGTVNAVTYNVINAVRFLFPVTVKTVDITCDFDGAKSCYDGEVKVTLRPAVIVSAAFSILAGLIKNYSRLTGKQNSQKAVTT